MFFKRVKTAGLGHNAHVLGCGEGTAVLPMANYYFSNKPLGASTAYARIAGLLGYLFSKPHTEGLKSYRDKVPKVDWEVMLLPGTVLGGFIAALSGGEFNIGAVHFNGG